MKLISFKDKKPEVFEKLLFYKKELIGGYHPGWYIGHYQQVDRNRFAVFIHDMETTSNNQRDEREFSHWMPLPDKP